MGLNMGLFEIQTAAYHGTNQSIYIDCDKVCSVEQRGGKALITFEGGSQILLIYFAKFSDFVKAITDHQTPRG